ncbi:MAG: hypothetical protein Q9198_004210 [Flavoplaca austrocitrina]
MESATVQNELPDSDSPDLQLTQATPTECAKIWRILRLRGETHYLSLPTLKNSFRSLMTDTDGKVEEVIIYGIASVFCLLDYRRRGYVVCNMKKLAESLRNRQSQQARVVGSVLYSDVESFIAVLQYGRAEAAEWQFSHVKLLEPLPWVQDVIAESNISHRIVEREEDSVASCLWYYDNSGHEAAPVWINNEHYAWC